MGKTDAAAERKKQADAAARAIQARATDKKALPMSAQTDREKAAYDARDKEKAKRKEVEAKLAAEKERREKAEAALAPNSWKLRPLVNVRPAMKMKYYPGGF